MTTADSDPKYTLVKPTDEASVASNEPPKVPRPEDEVPAEWNDGDVILDQYEVIGQIGEGGFGTVHKVHHKGWNVDMAVKSPITSLREYEERKLHREAEVWMELGLHPNIVSCHFVRNLGGVPRIFIEYVEGGTLHEWLYGSSPKGIAPTASMGEKAKSDEAAKKPRDLTRAQRLAIAIEICRGMHHAHTFQWKDKDGAEHEGVVHRDLKPPNILMTEDGTPRITDFGLVGFGLSTEQASSSSSAEASTAPKVLLPDSVDNNIEGDAALLTLHHGGAGTPSHMASEQFDPNTIVTKAADIYAFGVILYELFCGRRPFELPAKYRNAHRQLQFAEYERIHREDPPPDPKSLAPDLDPALAELMLHCLQKAPQDRPPSFAHIRNRLKATLKHLEDLDYDATHPEPKAAELLADSLNNRALSYLEMGLDRRATELWERALEYDAYHGETNFNSALFHWRRGHVTDESIVAKIGDIVRSSDNPGLSSYLLAGIHLERGDIDSAREILANPSQFLENDPWFTSVVQAAADKTLGKWTRCVKGFRAHGSAVFCIHFLSDARFMVSGSQEGSSTATSNYQTLKLWDVFAGRCIHTFGDYRGQVNALALSQSGNLLVTRDRSGCVTLWNVPQGIRINRLTRIGSSSELAFCPGDRFLISAEQNALHVWDLVSGNDVRTIPSQYGQILALDFFSQSSTAVISCADGFLVALNIETSQEIARLPTGELPPTTVRCIPDGTRVAAARSAFVSSTPSIPKAANDFSIRLYDLKRREDILCLRGHADTITSIESFYGGQYLISSSHDRTARIWDLSSGQCMRTLQGHRDIVSCVSASDKLGTVITGSWDTSVRLWKVGGRTNFALGQWEIERPYVNSFKLCRPSSEKEMRKSAGDAENKRMRAAQLLSSNQAERAYREADAVLEVPGHGRDSKALEIRSSSILRGCRTLLTDGWLSQTFRHHEREVTSLAVSGDESFLVTGSRDCTLRVSPLSEGRVDGRVWRAPSWVNAVACSKQGPYVVGACGNGNVVVWSHNSSDPARTLEGHSDFVGGISICFQKTLALTGCEDCTVRIWELSTGRCIRVLTSEHGPITSVAISPDERWVIAGTLWGTLLLWSMQTGHCLRALKSPGKDRHPERGSMLRMLEIQRRFRELGLKKAMATSSAGVEVNAVAFIGTKKMAVTASNDGCVRVWDLVHKTCLDTLEGHEAFVSSVDVDLSGRYIVSGSWDKSVRVWDLKQRECIRMFEGHEDAVTCVRWADQNRYVFSSSFDRSVRKWELVWKAEFPDPADWDKGAHAHLENFLTLHTPHAGTLPPDGTPTDDEVSLALTRRGRPSWTDDDFKQLLHTLGCAGYGWLRPEGVKRELEKMAADWVGPPELFPTGDSIAPPAKTKSSASTRPSELHTKANAPTPSRTLPQGTLNAFRRFLAASVPNAQAGARTPASDDKPLQSAPAPTQVVRRYCTNCGAQQSAEVKFCTRCGVSITDPPAARCPQCKRKISADEKFCTQCGTPLRGGGEQ